MLKETSLRLREAGFSGPAVLVDEAQARRNIRAMAEKARQARARFRPHFKTHQNRTVAGWFKEAGVRAITVSSAGMAEYFAAAGWNDITLAFLLNPAQWPRLERLARRLDEGGGRLGLTLDSVAAARTVAQRPDLPVDLWLKVDAGHARTGIPHDDAALFAAVLGVLGKDHRPRGLLTHAGVSYGAADDQQRIAIWQRALGMMQAAREAHLPDGEISLGDTPCCRTVEDLSGADEIRPGNFVFFDLMQWSRGVCALEELASAVVCPIVGLYPGDGRVVVHGGAVHLSRESLPDGCGRPCFGMAGTLWPRKKVFEDLRITRLSQEHGILEMDPDRMARSFRGMEPGDMMLVWPVHSCLSADLAGEFRIDSGHVLPA